MKRSKTYNFFDFRNYIKVIVLVFLLLLAGGFIIDDVLPYLRFDKEVYGHFWATKWGLIGHIAGALLALIIGPFQFWKSFRDYNISTHQLLGKVYVAAVILGASSATFLAWTSALDVHWTWSVSVQAGAFFWLASLAMAVRAILQKRIHSHRAWMIRSYVLAFAFILFRWVVDFPFIIDLGSFVERAPSVAWVSFTIPLFITEIILNWNGD